MNRLVRRVLSEPANVRGILLAVISGILLSGATAIGKQLTAELPPFQVGFVRGVLLFLFMLPWMLRIGIRQFRPHRWWVHIARAIISAIAVLLWFWALPRIPLAELIALEFTSPLFVLVAAILLLGERSYTWRWMALGAGFAGSMLIVRPGFSEVSPGMIAILLSAICFAANRVMAKYLLRTDTPTTLVVIRAVLVALFMLPPALFVWEWPTTTQWGWLLLLGGIGMVNQFTATWAIKLADLGSIEPVNFLRLVWAALIGFFFFAEVPSILTMIGGSIMIGSVVYVTRREHR